MLGQLCFFARSVHILDRLPLQWPHSGRYLALSGMGGSLWMSAQYLCVKWCLVCIQGSPALPYGNGELFTSGVNVWSKRLE